jgi:hypothetical protein
VIVAAAPEANGLVPAVNAVFLDGTVVGHGLPVADKRNGEGVSVALDAVSGLVHFVPLKFVFPCLTVLF